MEREALTLEALAIAMAAHNSGGIVIAQVERIAEAASLNPRQVKVPGMLVDCVVVAREARAPQADLRHALQPGLRGEIRVPRRLAPPMAMSERKIIARRAALELQPNSVVNLGIGMPEGVAAVADEEKIIDLITLTAEPGVIGGIPAGGLNFGAAINTEAVIDQPYQFDFYDGGGLDVAFLGLAQADRRGNVNVSKFGPKLAGAGGFINISQNAKKVVFVGTFNAGGPARRGRATASWRSCRTARSASSSRRSSTAPSAANMPRGAGRACCMSPSAACSRLGADGLESIEVAPGVDIERDILARMEFRPIVARPAPDGRAHLPRRADGPARATAGSPAGRALDLRSEAEPVLRQFRAPDRAQQERRIRALGWRSGSRRSDTASTSSSTTTIFPSCRSCSTTIPRWCAA